MRTNIWILLLASVLLVGCKMKMSNEHVSSDESEADRIAETITDAEVLKRWIAHYDRLDATRSSLIVRQAYGKAMRDISDFENAIIQHDTCITIARELRDTMQLVTALNNQGTNYRRLGDMPDASSMHYAALELCDKYAGDTSEVVLKNRVRSMNGLGNVMLAQNNLEMAEDMFRQALDGETKLGSSKGQAINLANLGSIKKQQGDLDSARVYYNRSMLKNMEGNELVGIGLCYQYLGKIDEIEGKTDDAIDNYRKGYNTCQPTGDVWHWLSPCISMAEIFMNQHRNDSAKKYVDIALEAAKRIDAPEYLNTAYKMRSTLYETTGQYKLALDDIKKSVRYKDSVATKQNRIYVQNLRIKYNLTHRTEKERAMLAHAETFEKTRTLFMWCGAVIIALITALGLLYRRLLIVQNRNEAAEKNRDEEVEKK